VTSVTDDELRRLADAVRAIPLEQVLQAWGADRHRYDRSLWRTDVGSLSVTGSKFFNWQRQQGSGGAIDLVIHLRGGDWRDAVRWLATHFSTTPLAPTVAACDPNKSSGAVTTTPVRTAASPTRNGSPLRLPAEATEQLVRVRRYLIERRRLAATRVDALIAQQTVYADSRANAVFRMTAGRPARTVGAELRGTGSTVWRGLAPGSRRDAGYFWTGDPTTREIILCESAIDAISCCQLNPATLAISTAGVRHDPPWLLPLLRRGYKIVCGFDDDDAGHLAARKMIAKYPTVERRVPPAHDWNDAIRGA
jgi:hypothetical protein